MPGSPIPLRDSRHGTFPTGNWPRYTRSREFAAAVATARAARAVITSRIRRVGSPTPHDVEPVLTPEGVFPQDWHPDPTTWGMPLIEESLFTLHYVCKLALFYMRTNFGRSWYDFWTKKSSRYRGLKAVLKEAVAYLANYREIAIEDERLRVVFDTLTDEILHSVIEDVKAKDTHHFVILKLIVADSLQKTKRYLELRPTPWITLANN